MRNIDPELKKLVRPQWGWKFYTCFLLGGLLLYAVAIDLELDFVVVFTNLWQYISDLAGRLFPPDSSNLAKLLLSMLETIEIALWGTFLAVIISIPFGILAARNITPNASLYLISRTIIIFFRAIPEFILAMFLVICVGFGPISGVFALGIHTMGFLSKFYSEEIEHVATEPIDALIAAGAKKSQILMFGIVPQILPAFVAYNLYILDRNVRMATMLGIVGAGGIGYELISSFRMFRYKNVTTIIIIIFVTILIIDYLSAFIRKKLVD